MAETRANPADGLLDVFHADTSNWVRAVAPLQIAGGFDVHLAGIQGDVFAALATDAHKLTDVLSNLVSLNSILGTLDQRTQQIALAVGSTISPTLGAIAQEILSLETQNVQLTNGVSQIAGLLNGGYNYSARIDALGSALQQLHLDMGLLRTELGKQETATFDVSDTIAGQSIQNSVFKTVPFVATDAQVTLTLPDRIRALRFRCRKVSGATYDIRYSYEVDQVNTGGRYSTLAGGAEYIQNGLNLVGSSLYLSCSNILAIAEVELYF